MKKITRYSAIALVAALSGIYAPLLDAQTPTAENSDNLENVVIEDDFDWTFPSEKESASVKDDIKELEEYSITEDDTESNLGLTEDEEEWGNSGDVENSSFEIEVYDY